MTTILIALAISISGFAKEFPTKKFEGRFEKVATGDYIHLVLVGKDLKQTSFVCSDLPKSLVKGIDCNDLQTKAADFKGKTLVVTYHEETNMIPEAQEKITWNYVDRIDLKK
jgi:hypothetical protein